MCVVYAGKLCFELCVVKSKPTCDFEFYHLRIIEDDFRMKNQESLKNIWGSYLGELLRSELCNSYKKEACTILNKLHFQNNIGDACGNISQPQYISLAIITEELQNSQKSLCSTTWKLDTSNCKNKHFNRNT